MRRHLSDCEDAQANRGTFPHFAAQLEFGPAHDKITNNPYKTSKDPGQPAHQFSIARVRFSLCIA